MNASDFIQAAYLSAPKCPDCARNDNARLGDPEHDPAAQGPDGAASAGSSVLPHAQEVTDA